MKVIARSLVVIFVALIAVPALAVSVTITTAVQLLATTALIMGGTRHPLSESESAFASDYMADAVSRFINPSATKTAGTPQETNGPVTQSVAVIYPAEFFPVFGTTTFDSSVEQGVGNLGSCLDLSPSCNHNHDVSSAPSPAANDFAVFGYSQSSVVASLVKRELINNPAEGTARPTSFVLAANPMRPNGGILGRGFEGMTIPIIGITFYGTTPTNSLNNNGTPLDPTDDFYEYPTVDVAQQYDLLGGDAPAVPYNILAWANSLAAFALLHGQVPNHSLDDSDVVYQGAYGDTQYYMIDSDLLPILMVLEQAGVPRPILAFANAPLQVLVESAYYRDISPGQHVGLQLLPSSDPITLTVNLVKSIPVGIDDGLDEVGLGRVLGTTPAGLYGVGGPETPPGPIADTPFSEARGAAKAAVDPAPTPQGPLVDTAPNDDPQQLKSEDQPKLDIDTPNADTPRADTPFSEARGAAKAAVDPAPTPQGPLVDTAPYDDPQQLKSEDQPKLDIDTPNADTPRKGTTPRPFQLLRNPIEFDPPKLPSGLRPSGHGPLKRIVNALSGQRSDPACETGQGEDPKPAQGVKSEDDAA